MTVVSKAQYIVPLNQRGEMRTMDKKIRTVSVLTCPECQAKQSVEMPTNACQHFYKCQICVEMLRPKEGDCCVFCSYADSRCPPKQIEGL